MKRSESHAVTPLPRAGEGFTLLELIIVIAIIGILAAIAMPAMKNLPIRAKEAALKTDLRTMRDVIDQYYGDKGRWPPSLEALVDDGYLRFIPVDPMTGSSETWQLEYEDVEFDEFAAETDLPEGGEPGIIDIHSGAELASLDGESLYSEW